MIDQTHLHLLSNHLPLFGSLMGLIVLGYGIWKRSNHTKMAAYIVLIVSSIGAVVAYLTGPAAADTVKDLQGVSKEALEVHAQAAQFAFYAFIIVALFSLIGIYVTQKRPLRARMFGFIVLFISLWAFAVVARTAYVGGQIRHSEIRGDAPAQDDVKKPDGSGEY